LADITGKVVADARGPNQYRRPADELQRREPSLSAPVGLCCWQVMDERALMDLFQALQCKGRSSP
jgi:hypothetical protein